MKYKKAYGVGVGGEKRGGGGLSRKVVCYPRIQIFFIVLLIDVNFSYKLAIALHDTMGSERLT